MDTVTIVCKWNCILKKKQLSIEGLKMNTPTTFTWKNIQRPTVTFSFTDEASRTTRVTILETKHILINNSLLIETIHNDKHMATIILTADTESNEILCRVGHFTDIGEFNELYYDESEFSGSVARFGWSVDDLSEDLFEECC